MKSAPPASDFLSTMARASHARLRELASHTPRAELEARARAAAPPLPLRVSPQGFELVAEIKFASPSAGPLTSDGGVRRAARLARRYAGAGAAALSVLTEPSHFGGALAHLSAAARSVRVPVMRKDFLVDPLQVLEARAAGASGVLLVVRLLEPVVLDALLDEAAGLGLFVLLEAFDEGDLERVRTAVSARPGEALLAGVNARDLATLAVDATRHRALAPALPRDVPCVAESGLEHPEHARAAAEVGYSLALIGSALTRARDPETLIGALLGAGRAAASERSVRP